jgi:uroporphyrinogen decarboxylase
MTQPMTPPERMMAVLMGQEKPDRVPVVPFIQGYASKIAGMPLGEFWADGDKYFDANFSSMRLHGYEQTPLFGYAACGPWEFGGKIGMPGGETTELAPYVIEPPVKTLEDIEKLAVPTFDGPLPGAYVIADRVAERCIEMGMPAGFQAGSIFSAAAQVADTNSFLTWVVTEPDAVHMLMDKVSDMFINASEYFANKFGAQHCMTFQAGPLEANGVISPVTFKDLVYPYNLKVNKKIKELGIGISMMHPCADQNLNIPYYVQMREECDWHGRYIWVFGPETSIPDQIKAFGDHDIICGNVSPVEILDKPYEDVVQMCKDAIELGKDSPGGFILTPGCEFPAEAAPLKVMAMMDAAEQFGRYE